MRDCCNQPTRIVLVLRIGNQQPHKSMHCWKYTASRPLVLNDIIYTRSVTRNGRLTSRGRQITASSLVGHAGRWPDGRFNNIDCVALISWNLISGPSVDLKAYCTQPAPRGWRTFLHSACIPTDRPTDHVTIYTWHRPGEAPSAVQLVLPKTARTTRHRDNTHSFGAKSDRPQWAIITHISGAYIIKLINIAQTTDRHLRDCVSLDLKFRSGMNGWPTRSVC